MTGLPKLNPVSSKIKLIGGGVLLLIVVLALVWGGYRLYHAGLDQADIKLTEYERQIEELNRKNLEKEIIVRERVIHHYNTRTLERVRVQYINRDIIRTVVPEQNRLSQGWVHAHDQSAKGEQINPALAADSSPSNVSDTGALLVVSENYNIANRTADQLEALQQYIREVGIPITNDPQTINSTK